MTKRKKRPKIQVVNALSPDRVITLSYEHTLMLAQIKTAIPFVNPLSHFITQYISC